MRAFMRGARIVPVVMSALLVISPSTSSAQSGSIRFTVTKAGFIVGVGAGDGTLYYQGRFYPLRVSGISLGTIGAAVAHLQGRVYNLKTAADIAGSYTAISGGAAFTAG